MYFYVYFFLEGERDEDFIIILGKCAVVFASMMGVFFSLRF